MKEAFKEALSRFASGVAVVAARLGEEERGMTATAFMSLSLEPPLVALGISERARLLPLLEEAQAFTVSLLREGQEGVSEHFAGRPKEGVGLLEGRVPGALAVLRCRLHALYPGGGPPAGGGPGGGGGAGGSGASFGLLPEGLQEVGMAIVRVGFLELWVRDLEKSLEFYQGLLASAWRGGRGKWPTSGATRSWSGA